MEKSKGRVRNFVVSNRELFCDMLAKTLCKMQVQYVQIENEFHFNDKILRFYTFEECLLLDGQVNFVCFGKDKIVLLDPQSLMFAREKEELNRVFLTPEDEFVSMEEETLEFRDKKEKKYSYTKQQRRQDNKMIAQRIKQNDMHKKNIHGYRRQVYKKY